MGGWLGHFSDLRRTLIESLSPVPWDTVVNHLWDKLDEFVAQDWIEARLHLRKLSYQATLLPVPAPRTPSQEVEVAGSLSRSRDLGNCTGSRGVTVRSLAGEPPQLLKDMEFYRCSFSGFYLHGLGWRGRPHSWDVLVAFTIPCLYTITCLLARTASPPRRGGVMRAFV